MFKQIKSHPRYEINRSGIIRNIKTKSIKAQYISSTGYYMISTSYKNKSNPLRVHRLIAETFINNPDNKPEVNHKDGNKTNNSIKNLEWVTHLENMNHAKETGLMNNLGSSNGMAKLNESDIPKIRELLSSGVSQYKISKMFNVSRSAILLIHLKKRWVNV